MAPGPKLPATSPMGKDIKRIVREMLVEELSVMAWNNSDDTITVQLMLGKEQIGMEIDLDVNWETDNGHGGGSYVTGLKVKVREKE